MHDPLEPQLEQGFGRVRHVLGVPKDRVAHRRNVNQASLARDVELVASRLWLRERLKSVPAVRTKSCRVGEAGVTRTTRRSLERTGHTGCRRGAPSLRTVARKAGPMPGPRERSERPGSAKARSSAADSFHLTLPPSPVH